MAEEGSTDIIVLFDAFRLTHRNWRHKIFFKTSRNI